MIAHCNTVHLLILETTDSVCIRRRRWRRRDCQSRFLDTGVGMMTMGFDLHNNTPPFGMHVCMLATTENIWDQVYGDGGN